MSSDAVRREIDQTLRAAYGEGLISPGTLAHRLDELLSSRIINPAHLVGDLSLRTPQRRFQALLGRVMKYAYGVLRRPVSWPECVLALDWSGAADELLLGRDRSCAVVLDDPTVSRRHAHLRYRDGAWIVRDLGSTNGTTVNGASVTRSQLRPGDLVAFGDQTLLVD
jgi:hypothetical protein